MLAVADGERTDGDSMHEAAALPEEGPFGLFVSREEMAQDHWKLVL
jgi:hypothetical protein